MAKWRLAAVFMAGVASVAFAGGALSQEEDVDRQTAEVQSRIGELRDEISLVNLVNGLNITEDQLTKMIAVLKEVQAVREEYRAKNRQLLADVEKAFTDLRSALNEGPILPPDISKRAGGFNDKVKELKEQYQEKINSYGPKVTAHLTDSQLSVVDTFKPCLLPPKNQKSPVRVGQASDNEQQIKLLRRLREMPQEKYDAAKKDIVAKGLEKYQEKKGKFSAEELAQETKRLTDVCDKVRALSPEEFELQKEEFGECAKPMIGTRATPARRRRVFS
jgi:hypothetical protein